MIIDFGTNNFGKSTELVLLKDPQYVKWALDKRGVTGPLLIIIEDFVCLIEIFDNKNLISKCYKCKEPAFRLSVYVDDIRPISWCLNCDPYSHGSILRGSLTIFSDYRSALNFVKYSCNGNKSFYESIIKNVAVLKGLPNRVGEKQVQIFFNS